MTDEKSPKSFTETCKGRKIRILNLNVVHKLAPGYLRGFSYAFLWFGSILLGFYFLYAPCLLILPFSRSKYRKISDTLFSSWEAFNVVSIPYTEL